MSPLVTLLALLRAALVSRRRLALENLAVRQQLGVLRRHVSRPALRDADRRFWIVMRRIHDRWQSCLYLVRPRAVTRSHHPT